MSGKKEYIERGALLKMPPFTKYGGDLSDAYTEGYLDCAEDARMTVKCSPAADVVEVRHGEWEIVIGSNGKEKMICTNCRHQQDLASTFTYCPNCGAKMDGERKDKP